MWELIKRLLPPRSVTPPPVTTAATTIPVPAPATVQAKPSVPLSARSERNLQGVHPDLVKVVRRAHELMGTEIDFIVIEGLRTQQRQAELVKAGASKTMNSRHITGHAVDLAASVKGEIRWDWPLYHRIAASMKIAAIELKIPIIWGGDWISFKDGPHFELDRKFYP